MDAPRRRLRDLEPVPPRSGGGAGPRAALQVSRSLSIPAHELRWRYSAGGGPGGQHANRSRTRVELTFEVASSSSLGPRQRAKLLSRFGPVVRVVAAERRSQAQNREAALERLRSRLAGALRSDPPRRPTSPSGEASRRRVEQKRRRGELKRLRGRIRDE